MLSTHVWKVLRSLIKLPLLDSLFLDYLSKYRSFADSLNDAFKFFHLRLNLKIGIFYFIKNIRLCLVGYKFE